MNPWPLWKKIGLRFFFIYFVLYILPFPLDYIPGIGERFDALWVSLWIWIVSHVSRPFVSKPITFTGNGSSDMTWEWVQILLYVLIAAIAAVIWSVIDRKRANDARLHQYIHAFVRIYLASAMFSYGIQKIIPVQFIPLSLDRLVQTYGSSSPMGYLWTFMGASRMYQMFAGASELLAAILLVPRRTSLLGALVTIGVMSNVVALNLSFDISVKTYSSHLLLMAVFLAAPDARRVAQFFVGRDPEPMFDKRWAHRGALAVRALLVAVFVYTGLMESIPFYRETISLDARSPLRGIWNVGLLDVDGVPRPPLVTDATRWRRVVFDFKGRSSIFLMNDDRILYNAKIDEKAKTIKFTNRYEKPDAFSLTYLRPDPKTLQLDGSVAGHTLHAVCKLDEKKFLLTTHGFHWIQERAVNR